MGSNQRPFCASFLSRYLACTCALILLVLLSSYRLASQSKQAGEIRGTVLDTSSAVVADVKVVITNVLTGVSQQITTDSTGVYEAPFVPPGEYSLTFEKDGFKAFVRNGIVLHVETIKVDVVLQVGSVSESMTVTALQPLVQTENAEKGLILSTQAVTDVPNVLRSWDQITGNAPRRERRRRRQRRQLLQDKPSG